MKVKQNIDREKRYTLFHQQGIKLCERRMLLNTKRAEERRKKEKQDEDILERERFREEGGIQDGKQTGHKGRQGPVRSDQPNRPPAVGPTL